MALLEDMFKGNPLTAVAVGIGAYLLVPMLAPVLRPAAKAVIKGGILAYQGVAELGEMAGDIVAEARSELDQGKTGVEAAPSPAGRRSGQRALPPKHEPYPSR